MKVVGRLALASGTRARFWFSLAALLLVTVCCTGCNAVILLGYLIGGPPSIEPDFDKQTGKSLAAKGKIILVYCYAPDELKWDNEALDYEIAKHVAHRLNLRDIRVVDPDRVHAWLDKNHNWDKAAEIGAAFGVDYVVYVDIKEYSLFEEHSTSLYRGRTDAIVSVVEMDKDHKDGTGIYSKELASRFPTRAPVSVDTYPYNGFKKMYLSRLSDEIGMLFYESYAGDDMPSGVL